MKKTMILLAACLFFPQFVMATDFIDTDQMYGWDTDSPGQFYQTWGEHKTQLGLIFPLKTNVLELDNTGSFTPDADYEPATKKYVDDNAGGSPGSSEITASSTLVSGLDVQYITATIATVQTFPVSGGGSFVNLGAGATVGQLTLTPPAGKQLCHENGACGVADQVLYSAGAQYESLEWNIGIDGNIYFVDEGGSYSVTP